MMPLPALDMLNTILDASSVIMFLQVLTMINTIFDDIKLLPIIALLGIHT